MHRFAVGLAVPFVGVAGTLGLAVGGGASAQNLDNQNPINATIGTTDFTVELVDVIRLPNSGGLAPRLDLLVPGPQDDGRLVANDQRGGVYAFTPGDLQPTQIFDASTLPGFAQTITAGNSSGFELGMRSFAFHPDFNRPGTAGFQKAYVAYSTFNGGGPNVFGTPSGFGTNHFSALAEFTVDPETLEFDANSRRDILKVAQPFSNHNVGQIAFKPGTQPGDPEHGLLYLGSGDGGSGNDPVNAGQRLDTVLGKILRIDPTPSDNDEYSIPADNPTSTIGAINPEIWATGLRAPTRLTWDDPTLGGDGRLYINEIGQDAVEEVNVGRKGANYGWKVREGTFVNNGFGGISALPGNHPTDAFTYPVAQYDHDFDNDGDKEDLVASIGGSVVRDPNLPQLFGHYVFGDFANQSDGPIYVVPVEELIERDDFSNVDALDDGLLAPFEELRLTRDGSPIDSFEDLLQDTTGNPFQNRTDTRFGYDANGGVYVLNKHDGWVRKLMAAPRELSDFDFSGASDATDADRILEAFGPITTNTSIFNLVTTGPSAAFIDAADFDAWLSLVGSTRGDADLDGQVAQGDLNAVLNNWGLVGVGYASGDLDGSGSVEQGDLNVVLNNWGDTAAPSFVLNPGVVPEPAAAAFVALGLAAVARRRRLN
ncbi:MAG: PQQ-dependent sugar dehydrogenase [Planctomycetota bacterium]